MSMVMPIPPKIIRALRAAPSGHPRLIKEPEMPPAAKLPRSAARKGIHIAINPLLSSMPLDRKSTRLNSSHLGISYAVFCLKKKKKKKRYNKKITTKPNTISQDTSQKYLVLYHTVL